MKKLIVFVIFATSLAYADEGKPGNQDPNRPGQYQPSPESVSEPAREERPSPSYDSSPSFDPSPGLTPGSSFEPHDSYEPERPPKYEVPSSHSHNSPPARQPRPPRRPPGHHNDLPFYPHDQPIYQPEQPTYAPTPSKGRSSVLFEKVTRQAGGEWIRVQFQYPLVIKNFKVEIQKAAAKFYQAAVITADEVRHAVSEFENTKTYTNGKNLNSGRLNEIKNQQVIAIDILAESVGADAEIEVTVISKDGEPEIIPVRF